MRPEASEIPVDASTATPAVVVVRNYDDEQTVARSQIVGWNRSQLEQQAVIDFDAMENPPPLPVRQSSHWSESPASLLGQQPAAAELLDEKKLSTHPESLPDPKEVHGGGAADSSGETNGLGDLPPSSDSDEAIASLVDLWLQIYVWSTLFAGNELERKALNSYEAVHQSSSSSVLFTRFKTK